ncbi:MAG: TRAP transporter small permease [Rudaea sp.]|nr:TRAP transporter small permease [Rudaea sp.]
MSETTRRALTWLGRLEDWLLAILVVVMVALAGAQIILRNFFDTGLPWADPFLRTLVLWTGILGALAAVRDDKHIALDVLQRFLAPAAQRVARVLTLGFAAAICASMAWYSIGLVQIDFAEAAQAGTRSPIPAWFPETILPVGFALMALRFALHAFMPPAHPPALLHDPGKGGA